ncbi:hypothetical protein J5N97_003458 [Dioscorea zingiberensis]|uniref:Uncharacterized protein n=1 Tax=Dioscorea zingiberensis TaxID=325984 RepID=A0A9D5D602_9LILI|nr:hypothetical protein J5N97_003458 [Dioscorea zingiberensis]
MEWWRRMVVPVKRAFVSVASRVKSRKDGGGILKLEDEVQTCEYRDVQVMWEMMMIQRSDMELSHSTNKRKK